MKYTVDYTRLAKADLKELDNSQRQQVRKLIDKVSQNPLPRSEGGYGSPLGLCCQGLFRFLFEIFSNACKISVYEVC